MTAEQQEAKNEEVPMDLSATFRQSMSLNMRGAILPPCWNLFYSSQLLCLPNIASCLGICCLLTHVQIVPPTYMHGK